MKKIMKKIKIIKRVKVRTNNKEIYNILLVGKDGISQKNSRSDTMIILTVDNKNKNLKLTSLARDTLVYIPKRGYDKLNHAFFYGGCDLLLKTINHNFDLNIKDYAIVDFKSFVEVINALDGVEVNIEDREIEALNKVINACYGLEIENEGNNIEYIKEEYVNEIRKRNDGFSTFFSRTG